MDQESRNELRRKKLCFSCKEPWEPGHRCLGKGKVHLIEVTSEMGDEEILDTDTEDSPEEVEQGHPQLELDTSEPLASAKVTMATLSSYPRFHAFRLKGILRGQRVMSLVDIGATHNFIDQKLVDRRGLQSEEFVGFGVKVADGVVLSCTWRIPQLSIQMGDYTLTDDFYVLPLEDYDVVLGMQWLQGIGQYIIDHHHMQLEFLSRGKKTILREASDGGPKEVTSRRMETIIHHDDIVWATCCLVKSEIPTP
jgi:hypothetical protein